ncbi:50S ribosomal protein L9 [Spirochaetia bacterium 38H-sp]|uniref:Large ribosomal subunit protein bL9 n=1 Tax=Rarispira pelagica TaxID=3141764 RepID=A0ABU9UBZ4_9SPIR
MKSTKVILTADVPNLGEEGDVKTVAPGYARNYLVPRGLALIFNKASQALIESRRHKIEKKKAEKREKAKDLKTRLESEELTIYMQAGEKGKLFGAVTSALIAEELQKKGIVVEKKRIDVPGHGIKMIGKYKVSVSIYEDEKAILSINVKAEGQQEEEKKEENSSQE